MEKEQNTIIRSLPVTICKFRHFSINFAQILPFLDRFTLIEFFILLTYFSITLDWILTLRKLSLRDKNKSKKTAKVSDKRVFNCSGNMFNKIHYKSDRKRNKSEIEVSATPSLAFYKEGKALFALSREWKKGTGLWKKGTSLWPK